LQIQIQLLSVAVETKPTAKGSYQQLEVAYKDLSNQGKVSSKKIMSFSNKKVFDSLSIAKPASTFEISMVKNDKGYWDWTDVKRTEGVASVTVQSSQQSGQNNTSSTASVSKGGWETPEERAKKQIYIVRQSSISAAVNALSVGVKTPPKAVEVIEYARELEAYVFESDKAQAVVSKDVGSIETIDEDIPF
jgi:hypothetical protein